MQCPKCQFENREGVRFCEECGVNFGLSCPNCSAKIPLGIRFCGECGTKLTEPSQAPSINYSEPQSYTPKFLAEKILTSRSSLEGERKLVTVLFADVANYTSISEKLDPEDVHLIMDGCFKILMHQIHHFEGTVNQFTGDGVMALFGAPIAHEDHAQRACYAALSIQKDLEKYSENIQQDYALDFKMRLGLNSGPVVVASIGDDLRMDYTAVGDTSNLAARLQSRSAPGGILISGATHKLVKDFFKFNRLGKIKFKGKEQLQGAYELIKAGEVRTRIRASVAKGLTKFVGRNNSMDTLKETYKRTVSGSGQIVGIVGEAGVGKSRLLFEFLNQLSQAEYTYLEGRCQHFGSGMIYQPILDIVRSYFEIKEGEQEHIVRKKIIDKTRQLNKRPGKTLSPFQELLSIKVDDQNYMQLDPEQKKLWIFEAIRDLLIRESEQKPILLVLEDIHWIDRTSEECINFIVDFLENVRILVIVLYRSEYIHQWESKSYFTEIVLTQLGTRSSSQLVQVILEGGEVEPELSELILSRAGGNPLFVEELTQDLLEKGLIDRKEHLFVLKSSVTDIQVPDTIQGIISARIDRLDERIKHVTQVASVIGREFAFRILQSILGMQEELKSYLTKLESLELISESGLFPELEYIFKHALTQEVAYNSLLRKIRKNIHENIGQAIESLFSERLEGYYELLAYHYSRSVNVGKAIHYLDMSNQKAIKVNAAEQAKEYFDEAMKLLNTQPETKDNQKRRISLLINLHPVMLQLFKYREYHDLLTQFESVAVNLNDASKLGAFYSRLGTCEWSFGNFDRAIQLDTKAVDFCKAADDMEEAAFAYSQMEWCYLHKGNYEKVFYFEERALKAQKVSFNLKSYSGALMAAAFAYSDLGLWDEAVAEGQQLLKVAEEFSDDSSTSLAASALSHIYNEKRDSAMAIEYAELAINTATTPGDKVWAEGLLASAWIRAGRAGKAIDVLIDIVPLMRAIEFLLGEVFAEFLGEGYFLIGEYERAKQTLDEVLGIVGKCGMKFDFAHTHRILGEVALKTESPQAANHFEKCLSICKEIKAENELALAYAGYGRYHIQLRNFAEARKYLTQALEIFERLGTLVEPEKILEELDKLPEA